MLKEQILSNLDNPAQLERLYRSDKTAFRRIFTAMYPDLETHALARFWHERLQPANDTAVRWARTDLLFIAAAALVAGLIAKVPGIFGIDEAFFYPRNIGFIVFPALAAFFAWRRKLPVGQMALIAGITIAAAVFINFLPGTDQSDTLVLSCIHLLLFLWSVLGFAFTSGEGKEASRLGFLKYNGDLVVMTTLILIACGITTGLTIGLFSLIGFNIEEFYFQNIVVFTLPAVPLVATWLIQTNPMLVGRVAPVIARIFSPLVTVMLAIYLAAILYSGKDPYNDREFLLLFNALLVGVMAIIFFSVAESTQNITSKAETWTLFCLSVLTVVVNGIALSAILFRISEWGITPNRAAVLGGNVLILFNLLLVTTQLFKAGRQKGSLDGVGSSITRYLPVYVAWVAIVTFVFPLVFGFK